MDQTKDLYPSNYTKSSPFQVPHYGPLITTGHPLTSSQSWRSSMKRSKLALPIEGLMSPQLAEAALQSLHCLSHLLSSEVSSKKIFAVSYMSLPEECLGCLEQQEFPGSPLSRHSSWFCFLLSLTFFSLAIPRWLIPFSRLSYFHLVCFACLYIFVCSKNCILFTFLIYFFSPVSFQYSASPFSRFCSLLKIGKDIFLFLNPYLHHNDSALYCLFSGLLWTWYGAEMGESPLPLCLSNQAWYSTSEWLWKSKLEYFPWRIGFKAGPSRLSDSMNNFYCVTLLGLNITMDIMLHTGFVFGVGGASAINSWLSSHKLHIDVRLAGVVITSF